MCFKVTVEYSSVYSKDFLVLMRCSHHCGPLVMAMQAQTKSKEQPSGCFAKCNTLKSVVPNSDVYFPTGINSKWKLSSLKHQI